MSSYERAGDLLVGVDVGGTKVAVLVVDKQARVRSGLTLPTAPGDAESALWGIIAAIRAAVEAASAQIGDVAAVGLGVPGRVDTATGVVRHAVNLRWREMPLGQRVSAELGVPCAVENDLRLAALGMRSYLGDAAPADMAYVSVGTGIGAGLVLNGRLHRGAHGMAGEIGHIVIEPGGPRCACGLRGCLEALAAGPAIARLGEAAARNTQHSLLGNYSPVTAEAVYEAARAGDLAAREVTRSVGRYLALAIQHLVMCYDVERVVLGGGVSRSGEAFLRPILEEIERLRKESPLAHEMLRPGMIHLSPPDFQAGAWGAVALAETC